MHTRKATAPAPATAPATAPAEVPSQRRGLGATIGSRFRLHTEEHAAPSNARLLLVTLWAAISIFIGLIPAGRLAVTFLFGSGPWWYPFSAATLGLLGVSLMVAAFSSIHRSFLPWYLMTIATLLLTANVAMVYLIPLS
ncbi:MAG TPA: hypothetical protein VF062_26340 [Candidatus Limnocylindrales bacterium]